MTGAMLLTNKTWQRNIASMITFFKTVTTVLLVDSLADFDEVSCYIVSCPTENPHGKEVNVSSGGQTVRK